MGRIIAGTALSGWLAIAWVAWHQADARIALCGSTFPDAKCVIRATAARDAIYSAGLLGALIILLVSLTIYASTKARRGHGPVASTSAWRPANRGQKALPR